MDDRIGDLDNRELPTDAVFDMEAEVSCPCCGETVTIGLDPGSGPTQEYIEDCQVCCQPWRVQVQYNERGTAEVWVDQAQ